ncbi:MAG: hypothetical protein C7B43_08470 [Sulfobacillus benefaciens]|uniref:Uncharacterized protein n=1 Tax=Sulfobacillus benefaciens TaxID=453960 RepID=A0A2T2X4K0_9FIRM|nr:MAG: hypothetical protein C7B43_08470 [Sulfobacillus benefaciens]
MALGVLRNLPRRNFGPFKHADVGLASVVSWTLPCSSAHNSLIASKALTQVMRIFIITEKPAVENIIWSSSCLASGSVGSRAPI